MWTLYGVLTSAQLILEPTETSSATVTSVQSGENPPPMADIRLYPRRILKKADIRLADRILANIRVRYLSKSATDILKIFNQVVKS